MAKVLVIGSGFAGSTATLLLTRKGHQVTLIERDGFIGGGCKTLTYGGHPYTFGPRHFLTQDESIFSFLNAFTPLRRIPDHEFLTYVERDPGFYHFPIHRDDVDLMPDAAAIHRELANRKLELVPANLEDYWINNVGPTLFSKFVDGYTRKMWGLESCAEFDEGTWSIKSTPLKTGPKAAWTEAISAFPFAVNGYDDYFAACASGAEVLLSTRIEAFDMARRRVQVEGAWRSFDLVVSTISPEIILNDAFGPLRWMGRELWKIVLPVREVFPEHVYFLYYANDEPFTRMVEYKKFYRCDDSPTTLIAMEVPSMKNQLYPYPMKSEQVRAQRYLDSLPEGVFSIGRAGRYDYTVGIAGAIQQAMDVVRGV